MMLSTQELLALDDVEKGHMMPRGRRDIAYDVLIPKGYIDAQGTWRLTRKGRAALEKGRRSNSVIRDLHGERSDRDPPSRAKQKFISKKIEILRREGYPERQSIAIAYRMSGEPARKARKRVVRRRRRHA